MKVRMLTIAAGPDGNLEPGDIVLLLPEVAKIFIEGGYAEPVVEAEAEAALRQAQDIEAAALVQPETAMLPAAKKRTTRSVK